MKRFISLAVASVAISFVVASAAIFSSIAGAQAQDVRIAMLVKSLGNGFFDAANKGGLEAAAELGNVKLIFTAPTAPTAEGQIEIINNLTAQNVDAIVISANDPTALIPATQRAMARGITVISFDSGIAQEGRKMQLNPSNNELIGIKQIQMASDAAGGSGEIAILSATAQATNQNIWIEEMRKELAKPNRSSLKLVDVVFGDDQSDKSYQEAQGLFARFPDLKVIIAPTTVGIAAAAQAVRDEKRVGKVFVTGLGLPSEMAGHVDSGAVKSFAIWNPIDLGYTATYAAYQISQGKATSEPGASIPVGRMGTLSIGATGEAAMAEPFTYDASNVNDFKDIF